MTVSTTDARFSYSGASGGTGPYSFPRAFISGTLKVYLDGVETDGFSVSGSGLSNGVYASGMVTLTADPGAVTVTVFRDPDLTAELALTGGGVYNTLNRDADRNALKMQALLDKIMRAPLAPVDVADDFDGTVADFADNAGRALTPNAAGDGWDFVEIEDASTTSVTTLGADRSRTLASRFADYANPLDWDGANDYERLAACWADGHRKIFCPPGMDITFDDGDTLTSTGEDVHIVTRGSLLTQAGNDPLFVLLGGWDNIQAVSAITADDGDGMPTYTVPSTTTIKSGHVMKIVDEQNLAQMTSRKQGEFGVVRTVPSSTTFTFSKTTRLSYSAASTCRVAKLNTAKIVCDFAGSKFDSPRGNEAVSGKLPMIVIEAALSPEVHGGDFLYVYNAGIMFQSCYEPNAIGVRGHVAVDGDVDGGSYAGITVFTSNSQNGLVLGGHQRRGRHYYTSRNNTSISYLGATTLSTYGADADHIVAFNKGQGCTVGFLSTHDGSFGIQFIGNQGLSNHKYDLKLRGHGHVVRDHRSRNGGVMVGVFVQNAGTDTTANITIENSHALNMRDGYLSVNANVTGPITIIGGSDVVESGYTTESSGRMLLASAITLRVRGGFQWVASNSILGGPIEMSIAGCTLDVDDARLDVSAATWSGGTLIKDEATGSATHTVKVHNLEIVGGSKLSALYVGTLHADSRIGNIRADQLAKIVNADTSILQSASMWDGPIWIENVSLNYEPGKTYTVVEDSGTNTVLSAAKFARTSSGTPTAGIGTAIELETETAANNLEVGATIESVCTDVTGTSEDFDLVFKTMAAGAAAAERARAKSTGNWVIPGGYVAGVQALSGAGAIDLVTGVTKWTTTGANAGTLADGAEGQEKVIVMIVDGGDGTLTPTNLANGTTITFNDAGDAVTLRFLGTEWWVIHNNGCTIA